MKPFWLPSCCSSWSARKGPSLHRDWGYHYCQSAFRTVSAQSTRLPRQAGEPCASDSSQSLCESRQVEQIETSMARLSFSICKYRYQPRIDCSNLEFRRRFLNLLHYLNCVHNHPKRLKAWDSIEHSLWTRRAGAKLPTTVRRSIIRARKHTCLALEQHLISAPILAHQFACLSHECFLSQPSQRKFGVAPSFRRALSSRLTRDSHQCSQSTSSGRDTPIWNACWHCEGWRSLYPKAWNTASRSAGRFWSAAWSLQDFVSCRQEQLSLSRSRLGAWPMCKLWAFSRTLVAASASKSGERGELAR